MDMKVTDPLQSSAPQRAYATLLQLLSVAWAYPTQDLFDAMGSGELQSVIDQALSELHQSEYLEGEFIARTSRSLFDGVVDYLKTHDKIDLETDYVALFENNFAAPVTHLYQHLYLDGKRTQIQVLKSVNQRYRRLGIVLKQGEGVEQADHLSVLLECLAFLYVRLAQNIDIRKQEEIAFYDEEVEQCRNELVWVNGLADKLHSGITHAFYSPLVEFTCAVLRPVK